MVINNHDAVDSPALPVFRDIRKVTGIRLPHLPEGVLLKSLSVPQVWVSCRFQVMFLHKTLDSADTDRSGDEGLLHQVSVDLGGVKPWKGLFEPEISSMAVSGSTRVAPLSERSCGMRASMPPFW